ncbi:MAG: glutamate--cysteine ligase [Gammaproteobacteria bacterium]|nr:glutamate--cysteine ligase [Gammaproteobacteria bacterium]
MLNENLERLRDLPPSMVVDGRHVGVEKESLRVRNDGSLSPDPHPPALGSALTHPYITTDFSEALLEVVTPPLASVDAAIDFLGDLHRFIYPRLPENETIWATSMPCVVRGDDSIPVGNYGNSNAGRMKRIYRHGLGLRYGKVMQTIAGVHFNYSWPDAFWPAWQEQLSSGENTQVFVTSQYFNVTRNLLRIGWLVPYLFGASPAVCRSFLGDDTLLPGMKNFKGRTAYDPYGTSLRMGDIGYQYRKDLEIPIHVCYNDLDSYVRDLHRLITTEHPDYAELGQKDANGRYQQLNTNVLQIENEYYSSVRPKQIPDDGEMPLLAMARRGIRYLELRSVDVDVFEPVGVSPAQLRFLEIFMLYALLDDSPPMQQQDLDAISANMSAVAHRGRQPDLQLQREGKSITLKDWGLALMDQMSGVAECLDAQTGTTLYTDTLRQQRQKMLDPETTPSARVLREMIDGFDSFAEFARSWSLAHAQTLATPVTASVESMLDDLSSESLQRQLETEAADEVALDTYLENYFRQLAEPELKSDRARSA